MYDWFTSLCSRSYHNIVKQLYLNKKINIKKNAYENIMAENFPNLRKETDIQA